MPGLPNNSYVLSIPFVLNLATIHGCFNIEIPIGADLLPKMPQKQAFNQHGPE
jgi:hypothetical protein